MNFERAFEGPFAGSAALSAGWMGWSEKCTKDKFRNHGGSEAPN